MIVAAAAPAAADAQQQGSVQLSTDTQIVLGHAARRGSERLLEPDFGALWTQPGRRFGQFQMEVRGSRRGDDIHLGRTWLAVRDLKVNGAAWTFEGGDIYAAPSLREYQFSNLTAPLVTFTGGAAIAKTTKTSVQLVAGRSTAWRNIFGTDPDALGQTLALARASYVQSSRLTVTARASRIRTSNMKEFERTIDASDQVNGGARLVVTPALHVVADGGFVRYRATGAQSTVNDYSLLAGVHLLISRGWLQVNASRFSPGDLPVLNASLQDREGIFSAGEFDLASRVRLFGGWETIDTNIDPTGAALQRPIASTTRGFGGVRVRVAPRSTFSLRIDDGDRTSRPVPGTPVDRSPFTASDTGSVAAELQSTVGRLTGFLRYTWRENVDAAFTSATFTQHDSAAQFFLNLSRASQFFGVATYTRQRAESGTGSSYLQLSGGGQQQLFRPGLWLRLEGSTSRMQDLTTGLLVPREAISVGVNGQIGPHTTLGVNVYADRAPAGVEPETKGWLTRSALRIVHTIPTGSVRVASAPRAEGARVARGTGTIAGSVFADWNANGQPDPGEELLPGIPIALGTVSHVSTGRDGQFSFLNVPAGTQNVRLDLNALPVDFDPPAETDVPLDLGRGETRRVVFGLVPLGSVQGRVIEDANRNGQADPGEPPVDNAVLVLDGGLRSELARAGRFRFEAIRAGDHRIQLLRESLPEGATIVSAVDQPAPVTREQPQVEVTYLVTIEKRPEVRKVFPPRGGGGRGAASGPTPLAATPRAPSAAPAPPAAPRLPAAAPRPGSTPAPGGAFTIQIAALTSATRARGLVTELKGAGFDAYLVAPAAGGDGLYRVRVGRYASRAAAQRTVARLERLLGLKMWITRAR
jgi:cell division septation protein DedD